MSGPGSEGPCANGAVSGSQWFHLISSHEVVPRGRLTPTYVALCGERVETSRLSDTECPNECECEFSGNTAYCPACLRAALGQNHGAGVDADGGVMVTVHDR